MALYDLHSIDAWRECEGGWTHNQTFLVERDIHIDDTTTPRQLLRFMRKDWLSEYSKGRLCVDNQFDFIEIQDKNTFEPIFILWRHVKP